MTVIISAATAKEKYPIRRGYKTAGGSSVRDCDDLVARALRGTGMDDWLAIADKNECRNNLDALLAAGKNTGQVRMALGRILRARVTNYEADPDKIPMPYLPEPMAASGPVEPPVGEPERDENDESEEDDEVAEEDEEEKTA